jgi:nonribosomal peptide synthetase protein BlmVI
VGLDRLSLIAEDCRPVAILIPGSESVRSAEELPELPGIGAGLAAGSVGSAGSVDPAGSVGSAGLVDPVDTDSGVGGFSPDPFAFDPAAVALLQYTSGSTGNPRGVIITNGNLMANQSALRDLAQLTARTTIVTWLPFFHDMGLCTGLVLPLVTGASVVRMEPSTFVRSPYLWLKAISAQREVFAAAPDFAYDLCTSRIGPEERATLDLSSWQMAVNGSEPVSSLTMDRFSEAFSVAGFRPETFRPGYGLAETTLVVTGDGPQIPLKVRLLDRQLLAEGKASDTVSEESGVRIVGCGRAAEGADIRIVDPRTRRELAEEVVGEVWVNSPSNGGGYWGRLAESEEIFRAKLADDRDGYLSPGLDNTASYVRTGDLGFLERGELYITGRIKDILIIGGINYFPQDAELLAVHSHEAFAGQRAAAWPLGEDEPGIAVVVETGERDPEMLRKAVRKAAIAVARAVPTQVTVLAVPRNKVPRTTSGKIRRRECAELVRSGVLPIRERWSTR